MVNPRFTIRTLFLMATIAAATCTAWNWLASQDGNRPVDHFHWNEHAVGIAKQRRSRGWRYAGEIPGMGNCIVLSHFQPEHRKYGQSGGYEVAIQLPLGVKAGDRIALSAVPIDRKGELQPHDRRFTLMLPGEFTARTFGDHFGSVDARSEIRASTITIRKITADYVVVHAHIDVTIPEFYNLKLDREFTTRRVPQDGG